MTVARIHVALYALALAIVFPFVWMLSTSLKPEGEVFSWPPRLLPWPPVWSNYRDVWEIARQLPRCGSCAAK